MVRPRVRPPPGPAAPRTGRRLYPVRMYGTGGQRLYLYVETYGLPASEHSQDQGRPETRWVRVSELVVGFSPREVVVDHEHVETLLEVLDRLPPIVVEEATMRVVDGLHRLEAFRRAGRAEIMAVMFSGDATAALAVAIQANIRHGKPLSRRERQVAATRLLRQCPERSDRWVATVCGLSHATVGQLRRAVDVSASPVRVGRDGRRRPVDPAPGQMAAAKALADRPGLSVRDAARAARVAASTVHRLAAQHRSTDQVNALAPGREEVSVTERDEGPMHAAPHATPFTTGFQWWLERTAVSRADSAIYLATVPLEQARRVVAECRHRAEIWNWLADSLDEQTRDLLGDDSDQGTTPS